MTSGFGADPQTMEHIVNECSMQYLGVTAGLHGVIEAVINDAINTVTTH